MKKNLIIVVTAVWAIMWISGFNFTLIPAVITTALIEPMFLLLEKKDPAAPWKAFRAQQFSAQAMTLLILVLEAYLLLVIRQMNRFIPPACYLATIIFVVGKEALNDSIAKKVKEFTNFVDGASRRF